MKEVVAGLDFGAEGAIVLIKEDNSFVSATFDKEGGSFNEQKCFKTIWNFIVENNVTVVYGEKLASIFGSSAKANMTFGKNIGVQMCGVWAADARLVEIHSKTWQSKVINNEDIIMTVNPKTGKFKNDTKKTALNAAGRLFPGKTFLKNKRCSTPHDGIVDALLIAHVGNLMENNNKSQ